MNYIKIPSPYNKIFRCSEEVDEQEKGDWLYKEGDIIEGYDCHFIAYLEPIDKTNECYPILTDDPEFPVVELIGGRLYPVTPGEVSGKMKYAVTFAGYDRYSEGSFGCEIIEAESDVEALVQIEEKHGYGNYADEIEDGKSINLITVEEIKEYIESDNGDGTDFIISIINLSTEEIIFIAD